MVTFYFLVGLSIAIYIIFDIVQPILQDAIKDGVDNPLTRYPVLTLIVNMFLIACIWFIFVPVFFSPKVKEAVSNGFAIAINSDE